MINHTGAIHYLFIHYQLKLLSEKDHERNQRGRGFIALFTLGEEFTASDQSKTWTSLLTAEEETVRQIENEVKHIIQAENSVCSGLVTMATYPG